MTGVYPVDLDGGSPGGRWERIEPMIVAALCARDIPTTVYDFD